MKVAVLDDTREDAQRLLDYINQFQEQKNFAEETEKRTLFHIADVFHAFVFCSCLRLDAMNHFFMLQNMFVVGSSYWPIAYGQMPGDVLKDEEGISTIKALGQNMAYLLKALEERKNAGECTIGQKRENA